ncbi:helicase HerA domain-containing protein [Mycobacterium sp. pW049]|uniref:helicase HerA domain-containing protein n=1 Tax=[Mycobacterium] bulgaricum TaxID=3238985 RepID=UPI00351B4643
MDVLQRDALSSLRLTWAPTSDDLWRPQAATHVTGLNEHAVDDVIAAFGDAQRDPESAPLGVVIRGPAGSGKTHLLGQIRERVQVESGFFFVVELLDAASFWQSVRSGILESLGRPGAHRETQLKDLLWELSSLAHVSRADRRAIIGDDDLDAETLYRFIKALSVVAKETVWQCHQALRALVLLGSNDFVAHDIGEGFLQGSEEFSIEERGPWGLRAAPASAQECVRDISRLVALAGPAVLAVDQIDTLLAQSLAQPSGDGVLEQVAHGLMALRQTTRRTVPVVACLPAVWEHIQDRAAASVADRFRVTGVLSPLPSADVGRAILERRFSASYRAAGFTPPYPSWPLAPVAFEEAPSYTPRQLLIRADTHVRECLKHGDVVELEHLSADAQPSWESPSSNGFEASSGELDRRFAEYRRRAVPEAAIAHDGEDTTMPELLSAALTAWIAERDGEQTFVCDPPPGTQVMLHARLRENLDRATEDERHWAFRAVAASNASAALSRVRKAITATGFGPGDDRRQLYLLRNSPWPSGKKTAEVIEEFHAAGGQTLPLSEDDIRTMTALRDLINDDNPELPGWLRARKPAHGLALLIEALGLEHDLAAVVEPEPEPVDDDPVHISETEVPLGFDLHTGTPVTVDLSSLRKHVAIFAGSGSGKTVLIRRLVEECALRGVSSIVLDPNNDLSRLGAAWPQVPMGWRRSDDARADDYLANTEVTIWTPRRTNGRPLAFQPLPDFSSVLDDADEFTEAVEAACSALEPRALITGKSQKATRSRAVLREALQRYGRTAQPDTGASEATGKSLAGFIRLLADLPDDVSDMAGAHAIAGDLSQNLRAAMVNDPLFGGAGTPVDPGVLLTPSDGYRARVSVISMIGLASDEQRQSFVNQLQMALFAWIKRHPAGDKPLGGLLVMDEAQNFAPARGFTPCTRSTLALSSQARKYGLGLVFATQAPKGLNLNIPGNAATQFYGLLNAPAQIETAREMARAKGGLVDDISRLRAGNFYVATEGEAFHRIVAPWCLSHHPPSPPSAEEVLSLAVG